MTTITASTGITAQLPTQQAEVSDPCPLAPNPWAVGFQRILDQGDAAQKAINSARWGKALTSTPERTAALGKAIEAKLAAGGAEAEALRAKIAEQQSPRYKAWVAAFSTPAGSAALGSALASAISRADALKQAIADALAGAART